MNYCSANFIPILYPILFIFVLFIDEQAYKSLRGNSKFYTYFKEKLNRRMAGLEDEGIIRNDFYDPELIDYFLFWYVR